MNRSPILLLTIALGTTWLNAQSPGSSSSRNYRDDRPVWSREETPRVVQPAPGEDVFLGGVPSGAATSSILPLSLSDAISRGLRQNLGVLITQENFRSTRGAELRSLSELLPHVTTATSQSSQQVNLAAFGFSGFPGVRNIIGPFGVFDTRLFLSQNVFDLPSIESYRANRTLRSAAELDSRDARDFVVLVVGNLYLQAVAAKSRITAAQSQLETARALYNLSEDRKRAGVAAGIDVLRSQVELEAQRQRVIVSQNEFARQKLNLARAIGLPLGQEFEPTDDIGYGPIPMVTVDQAIARAYEQRSDYLAAEARVTAAELQVKSAAAERLPSLALDGDYGVIGRQLVSSHGTYTVAARLRIPIFEGNRVRGRVLEAEADLQRNRAQRDDVRSRIYYEVRSAFLDLNAAAESVKVARSALDLAHAQVEQARDRFSAGVAGSIELVQAQEALALADENLISGLYSYNLAKGTIARAMGVAEESYREFILGK